MLERLVEKPVIVSRAPNKMHIKNTYINTHVKDILKHFNRSNRDKSVEAIALGSKLVEQDASILTIQLIKLNIIQTSIVDSIRRWQKTSYVNTKREYRQTYAWIKVRFCALITQELNKQMIIYQTFFENTNQLS